MRGSRRFGHAAGRERQLPSFFGIHQQIGRSFSARLDSVVDLVSMPLKHAAWRHIGRLSATRTVHLDASQADASQELGSVDQNRFYFHIDNGRRYPDETGSVFLTTDDAVEHAAIVAHEFAQDGSWSGFAVVMTDRRGREIVRLRIG